MPAISTVRVSVDMAGKLKAATAKLLKREVLVGIPDSTAQREPTKDDPKPASNALIGYVLETGDPEKNLPARPFLVPGVENAKSDIIRRMQQSGTAALNGNEDAVESGLMAVGLVAQNAVRAKMTEGPFAALSPRTLTARERAGRTGDKPLIDTGALRQSISFVVRDKGSA